MLVDVQGVLDMEPKVRRGRGRRARFAARVKLDGIAVGTLHAESEITPVMRRHGVTQSDVAKVLYGLRRAVTFRCGGLVVIEQVPMPKQERRRSA